MLPDRTDHSALQQIPLGVMRCAFSQESRLCWTLLFDGGLCITLLQQCVAPASRQRGADMGFFASATTLFARLVVATTMPNCKWYGALQDVGFANILSKTHLSNNNAFTFAWAAPEARARCSWRRLACPGRLLAPCALACMHRPTGPCLQACIFLWRRTQTPRTPSIRVPCLSPGADEALAAQVLMGTSCTEKADIYSCAPLGLALRALRPGRGACKGLAGHDLDHDPGGSSGFRHKVMKGLSARAVAPTEGVTWRASVTLTMPRRLGVTLWEICTGEQPKRGQLRACRRGSSTQHRAGCRHSAYLGLLRLFVARQLHACAGARLWHIVHGLSFSFPNNAQCCLIITVWARLAQLLSVTKSGGLGVIAALTAAQGAGGVPPGGGAPDAALPGVRPRRAPHR